jgi:alpha-tubulin suppressor-like RCC1 family protein
MSFESRSYGAVLASLLCGCSLIAPIRDHTFDLEDAGGIDGGRADGGHDAGADGGLDAGPQCEPACMEPREICVPEENACVECREAADCDDGVLCTVDRCDTSGTCSSVVDDVCVASIDAGEFHTCAVLGSGEVYCWGANTVGQLGNGASGADRTLPQRVDGLTDAVQVSAGDEHTCAVRRTGEVVCWGSNDVGQLGNSTVATYTDTAVPVTGLTDVIAVSAGGLYTCALRRDGTVACWGINFDGQVGNDTMTASVAAADEVVGLEDGVRITAGLVDSCAVREGGEVVCWGGNYDGEFGNAGSAQSSVPVAAFTGVSARDVAAGGAHICVVRTDGDVLCAGNNDSGQLGDGSMSDNEVPTQSLEVVGAIDVEVGGLHSCALGAMGNVWCWGANVSGQVGNGESGAGRTVPNPASVMMLSDAIMVTAGSAHTCARTRNNDVLCWGDNSRYQLGTGTASREIRPLPFPAMLP